MYGKCSMQNVIESDGTVYPCDFYALDAWAMGNIKDPALDFVKLWQWSVSEHPAPFFRESAKRDARCSGCRWYPLCRGGCRRDCETEKEGFRNVYCEAYQNFFCSQYWTARKAYGFEEAFSLRYLTGVMPYFFRKDWVKYDWEENPTEEEIEEIE